jgi:hypothetical protein
MGRHCNSSIKLASLIEGGTLAVRNQAGKEIVTNGTNSFP